MVPFQLITPVPLLYVTPPLELNDALALAVVKYWLLEPSATSSVSPVNETVTTLAASAMPKPVPTSKFLITCKLPLASFSIKFLRVAVSVPLDALPRLNGLTPVKLTKAP